MIPKEFQHDCGRCPMRQQSGEPVCNPEKIKIKNGSLFREFDEGKLSVALLRTRRVRYGSPSGHCSFEQIPLVCFGQKDQQKEHSVSFASFIIPADNLALQVSASGDPDFIESKQPPREEFDYYFQRNSGGGYYYIHKQYRPSIFLSVKTEIIHEPESTDKKSLQFHSKIGIPQMINCDRQYAGRWRRKKGSIIPVSVTVFRESANEYFSAKLVDIGRKDKKGKRRKKVSNLTTLNREVLHSDPIAVFRFRLHHQKS